MEKINSDKKRIINNILKSNGFFAFLFLLPAFFFFTLYLLAPIPLSGYYSLLRWSGVGEGVFIGLNNWSRLIRDSTFWLAVGNNFKLVFLSLLIQLPTALFLAVVLTSKIKLDKFFKTVYFFPMLLSTVAIGVIWGYIYNPNVGLLNNFLEAVGLEHLILDWLGSRRYAIYSTIVAICWRFVPFHMILYIAGIVGIPEQLYEAAEIDGANAWVSFRHITLPQLKTVIKNSVVLSIVGSLKIFAEIFVMTGGGPNHASEVMATYMYTTSFDSYRMGYGSTIAVSLFLIAFSVSLIFLYLTRKKQ